MATTLAELEIKLKSEVVESAAKDQAALRKTSAETKAAQQALAAFQGQQIKSVVTSELLRKKEESGLAMIAAKGPDLYAYNAHGAMWPAGDWDVCGASATTALAWLTNHAPTGMDEAEARARARQLYEFMSAAELSIGDGLDIEVT